MVFTTFSWFDFGLIVCMFMISGFLRKYFALGVVMAIAFGSQALACETLVAGPRGRVVSVTDGDTVVLDNDMAVRLIGIQAPKLPLGRQGYPTWPLAEEAKQALEDIALGQNVVLRYGTQRMDRHGRQLAHMFVGEDEVWAQRAMLEQGLARVYSFYDNRLCLDELLKSEGQARADRVGIWDGVEFYAIRRADRPAALLGRVDSYEIVEGRIMSAARVRNRVYLNFGSNWREDFTVIIERNGLGIFEREGIDPLQLEDALVRVRGWVENRDGPRIEVTHPEQIELLARL